jgi:DNA-binding CsgD family transcriptional regulator
MSQKTPDNEKDVLVHPYVPTEDRQQHPYAYYLAQIIAFSQRLYGVDENIEARLAEEISAITNDQAHLYLHRQVVSPMMPIMIAAVGGRRGFLVRWGDVVYGSLQVCYVAGSNDQLAISIDQCERLANDCGWCLHVLESEKKRQFQNQQVRKEAEQKVAMLSASERQVLELMVQGLSTRTIAEKLQVSKRTIETHQRHIYQMFDVHSQREAVLIGLTAGMNVSRNEA